MYSIQDSLLDLGSIYYNVWWSIFYTHRLMGLNGNNCTMWTWDMNQDDKARIMKLYVGNKYSPINIIIKFKGKVIIWLLD
jgi:hypothetical protein